MPSKLAEIARKQSEARIAAVSQPPDNALRAAAPVLSKLVAVAKRHDTAVLRRRLHNAIAACREEEARLDALNPAQERCHAERRQAQNALDDATSRLEDFAR